MSNHRLPLRPTPSTRRRISSQLCRVIVRGVLCLLIGIALTLGLGIAGYARYRTEARRVTWSGREPTRSGLSCDGSVSWHLFDRLGFSLLDAFGHAPLAAPADSGHSMDGLPSWASLDAVPRLGDGGSLYTLAVGVPLRYSVSVVETLPWTSAQFSVVVRRGRDPYTHPWPWAQESAVVASDIDVSPTHTFIVPFGANIGFWTAISAITMLLPAAWRRTRAYWRRRRGNCEICGYSLVGVAPSSPCPECGERGLEERPPPVATTSTTPRPCSRP